MAERDRFELDLAAALRAYLEDAPTDVRPTELARHFATAYPHRRPAFGRWGFGLTPAVAWLMLLLAGLLVALVGGTLLVGSQLQRKLPAVVPNLGPVATCPPGSTPDQPGPVDQPRPIEWMGVFDRRAGRLVAVGDGPVETWTVETWTFDVCTNTWLRMHPDRTPRNMNQLVYDVDSDVTIASDGVRMWAYDLEANTWTERGQFAPVGDAPVSIEFYDPVSGLIVALGDDGDKDTLGLALWSYDVETDTWTPILQARPPAIGPHNERFAYDASVDRIVAHTDPGGRLGGAGTWLFDLRTGTWSETGAVTPRFSYGIWGGGPSIAYDEAAERTVMLGQGHSAAYDATADRWETRYGWSTSEDWWVACGTRPECREQPSMVYDPANERLIVYGAVAEDAPDDLLAFDTRTGEWTVLLAASERQPSPP